MKKKYSCVLLMILATVGLSQTTHQVSVSVNQGNSCPIVAGLSESPHFKVYPNPTHALFTIEIDSPQGNYRLINTEGKILRAGAFSNRQELVHVDDLAPGIYILFVTNQQFTDQIKIRVQ